MSKFKVGDYVRVKKFKKRPSGWNTDGKMDHLMGKICKVTGISVFGDTIKIYDKKYDYSWRFNKEEVEKVSNTIVIYMKGNQVIALDKATGKKAVAKCHPDDEFDFNIGAKLAFERLMVVSYEISVKEMRDKLYKYCVDFSKKCSNCDLGGRKFRCGMDVHFRTKYMDGTYKMSDEEIRAAYKTIFGDKEKEEPKEEEPKEEEPKKEPKKGIQDFAKAMYEIRSALEKAGFTKQESMDFVIKLSLKALYPN